MELRAKHFLYVPNILSVIRILAIPLPVIFIASGRDIAALLMVVFGVITDVADGWLARKLNQVSDLGKLLDPLADKLSIAVVIVALCIYKDFPWWAAAIILGRDFLILVSGLLLIRRVESAPTSNMFGKLTALCWSLLIISYLTPYTLIQQGLLVIAIVMAPVSFLLYILQVRKSL